MRPFAVALVLVLGTLTGAARSSAADSPEQVFASRILPIFKSPDPSSCVRCHLAGVDLKNYIRPSHRETFLSLRDQGLIDLDKPENSRILALIDMGKNEKGASLIQEKTRKAEYEAFAAWVKASAADPELRNAPKLSADKIAKPPRPNEVIRHARKDQLLESFTNTIWAMRFRCMSCHIEGSADNKKHVAEHGERVAWFKAAGPEATLKYLMSTKLIDTRDPENSMLLKKPLGSVKHGGGVKFLVGDEGYKAFRRFVEDYARIINDQYAAPAELPKPEAVESFGSEAWLKLANTPPAWADKLLLVRVYAWDSKAGSWEVEPIASSDRKVWGGGKLWQHTLTLHAARGSERAKAWKAGTPALPRGKYLVKVYVDVAGKTEKDWTAELTEADCVGRSEVQSAWPTGYGKMTVLDAGKIK
jgi:hypothetical protein